MGLRETGEEAVNDKLAKVDQQALAVAERPASMLQFTPEQSQIIRDMCANGASETEFAFLMEIAKARKLNPLLKQIHFVKRWDSEKNRYVWAAQVGIDGFRSIAEQTGLYDGQDEPEYGPVNDKGFPQWSKVRVYKKGVSRPFVGTAYWAEYVQTNKSGAPTRFWSNMPMNQLAKCAESLALRKAFPEQLGGIYSPEEMQQADNPEHEDRRRGPITPNNSDQIDESKHDQDVADELLRQVKLLEDDLAAVDSYDKVLALRARVGESGKQSEFLKAFQAARDTDMISADERKEIARIWNKVNRALAKKEQELKPDVTASFVDDADDYDRSL